MALHDVDKDNLNRSAPMPNVHNQLPESTVKAHQTASSHYSLGVPSGYLQQRNTQFIANDGTVNKALFGFNSALSKWGIFQTIDGVDVLTNTDLSKFIFNSTQDTFKITGTGTVNLGTNSGGAATVATVAHGLTFAPMVIAFGTITDVVYGTRTEPLPHYTLGTTSGISSSVMVITAYCTVKSDSTNITFTLSGSAISTTATVRYYILQETASSS